MRLFGLLCAVVVTACASASPPGELIDAGIDASGGKKDAAIDASLGPDALNTCPSAMTCAGAMALGMVSGDSGNMKLSANGYQAAWFRVRVTEDDSEILGLSLRVSSKLTFPASVGFETYVYVNSNSDVAAECAITTGTRSTVGNVQTVKAEWGEGTFSNGSSDSRNVTIEVRPVGINCAAGQEWQLEVEGNWN
jgi:hypothetical protein